MQSDDMQAIRDYISATPPQTPDATAFRTQFLAWYDGLSFYDRTLNSDSLADAQAKRDAFNQANAVTQAAKDAVANVQATAADVKRPAPQTPAKAQAMPDVPTGTHRVLKKGMVGGDDIAQMQAIVGAKSDAPNPPNFGPQTESKVKLWQATHGLPATGIFDEKSWTIALGKASLAAGNSPAVAAASVNQALGRAPVAPSPAAMRTAQGGPAAPKGASAPPVGAKAVEQKVTSKVESLPLWGKIVGAVLGTGAAVGAVVGIKKHLDR